MQHAAGIAQGVPTLVQEAPPTVSGGLGAHARFCRQHRLVKHEVEALLGRGARLSRSPLAMKLNENTFGQGRIAIAVPKRILKHAVDRNKVKRVIREQFRQHGARQLPVDMLFTLQSQLTGLANIRNTDKQARGQLRQVLKQLLADVSQRFDGFAR